MSQEAEANFNTAELTFGQLGDMLSLTRSNIDEAMRSVNELDTYERHKLNTMSRTLRTMTQQFRNAR